MAELILLNFADQAKASDFWILEAITMRVEPFVSLVKQLPAPADAVLSAGSAAAKPHPVPVSVSFGDGIGPEITTATLRVLEAAGANLSVREVKLACGPTEAGLRMFDDALTAIRTTKVLLKGPYTPLKKNSGGLVGHRIVREFGLYARIEPFVSYHPFVYARDPETNVIIITHNDEDVSVGIEHRQTDDVYQSLRIISRSGCERTVRFAFEFAAAARRRKVSCFTDTSLMELTDGLFQQIFDEVGAAYHSIAREHLTINPDAGLISVDPARFDVIVCPGMHGNILSALMARNTAPAGCVPRAHLGAVYSMFEAAHGPAHALANKDLANPSGLLLASIMMLIRIGRFEVAELIHNAWLRTIEDGFHTADLFSSAGLSKRQVGTTAFTDLVIGNLGEMPSRLRSAEYRENYLKNMAPSARVRHQPPTSKKLVGVDVFVHWRGMQSRALAETMRCATNETLDLIMITNRGAKVWPGAVNNVEKTDQWRCRYRVRPGRSVTHADIAELQSKLAYLDVDFIKTDHLYNFDGSPDFVKDTEANI